MPADQISAIAPYIREALEGGPSWCATFEVSADAEHWVQFKGGVINAAYPRADAPDALVRELDAFELQDWAPDQYVMGALNLNDARAIARWIDTYFVTVLGCGPEYPVDASLEEMM